MEVNQDGEQVNPLDQPSGSKDQNAGQEKGLARICEIVEQGQVITENDVVVLLKDLKLPPMSHKVLKILYSFIFHTVSEFMGKITFISKSLARTTIFIEYVLIFST